MAYQRMKLLILCKTYPSPRARHVETSCVTGMKTDGQLLRLYPVPFRLMNDQSQFGSGSGSKLISRNPGTTIDPKAIEFGLTPLPAWAIQSRPRALGQRDAHNLR